MCLPLPDEAHVADWRRYVAEGGDDVWSALQRRLPQLAVPIREGQAATPAYAAVMRSGQPLSEDTFDGRLTLQHPERFRVEIHEHPFGALPVLLTPSRDDFETLYRALAGRSEPIAVNPAVNAQMIAGVINWDRAHRAASESNASVQVLAQVSPESVYDRVMLLCEAPYSGREAGELALSFGKTEWIDVSTRLRMEHEFAHYATKRIYGAMRLNLFDELVADTMGMTHALGEFRAHWFVTCLGLEQWPVLPSNARVHTYRADLSDEDFAAACTLAMTAAGTVERLATRWYAAHHRAAFFLALTQISLDALAMPTAERAFADIYPEVLSLVRIES